MKDLKEALINKNNIKSASARKNKFGITEKDLTGNLKGFPLGVVIRMLEEQEKQGNKPNIEVFQKDLCYDSKSGGFTWYMTNDGRNFWYNIIEGRKFDIFYKKYPEYKKYDK